MKVIKFDEYALQINPISPLVNQAIEGQYKKKNPEPVQPTYSATAVGGIIETFLQDETTIETDEEKKEFATWKEAHDKWQTGLVQKVIRMFLLKGVTPLFSKEQEEELALETSLLDMDVPNNKKERDLFYLEIFVVNTQERLEQVMQAVLGETGVRSEVLEQANDMF